MNKKAKFLLTEMIKDFDNVPGEFLPLECATRQALAKATLRGDKVARAKLAESIGKDLKEDIGVIPPKETKIIDAYSNTAFPGVRSVREDNHQLYWLLKEDSKNGHT